MEITILDSPGELGRAAAKAAVTAIRHAIDEKQSAHIILATGASQFETLNQLTRTDQIDWSKVTMFHLDEYLGLDETHPAGFVRYLKDRFVDEVGDLKAVHFINGQAEDAQQECRRLGEIINEHRVDVGLIGIGENGHLAFNDPPADFKTQEAYLIVELDEACRTQQVNEGWFQTLDQVPRRAISMSVHQIMKSQTLIVSVPDERKAAAVQRCVEGEISPMCPTSILQRHTHCKLFLDRESASLLKSDMD